MNCTLSSDISPIVPCVRAHWQLLLRAQLWLGLLLMVFQSPHLGALSPNQFVVGMVIWGLRPHESRFVALHAISGQQSG